MSNLFQTYEPKTQTVSLRDYQRDALKSIRDNHHQGKERGLVVMPTGTGKTVLFSEIAGEHVRESRVGNIAQPSAVLVLAHREELLEQAADKIGRQNPSLSIGIEAAERRAAVGSDVVIASVPTLARGTRLPGFRPGRLIIDEAHHAAAESYQKIMERYGCYDGECLTNGFTATPHRLDNKPLHAEQGRNAIFESVFYSYSLRDAISDGYLVDIRGYIVKSDTDLSGIKKTAGDYSQKQLEEAVNTSKRTYQALAAWKEICPDRQTIVFCAGVSHAHAVAEIFRANGISAEAVDGTMHRETRRAIMERVRNGQTQVLANVQVATEGFDVPNIGCVLMLRPTMSWALYTQMAGRGTRVLPGVIDGIDEPAERRSAIAQSKKRDLIVIDLADQGNKFSLASVPALMGLPPKMNLQGRGLLEAATMLSEAAGATALLQHYQPESFADLQTMLERVDLLANLQPPTEVQRASKMAWQRGLGDSFVLSCGSQGRDGPKRTAYLESDSIGAWVLRLTLSEAHGNLSVEAKRLSLGSGSLSEALHHADSAISAYWPDASAVTNVKARWRGDPATPGQLKFLAKLGFETSGLTLTKGEAANIITSELSKRG